MNLSAQVLAWCGGAIVLSSGSYPLMQLAREREWCSFVGSSPHEFKAQLRGQLASARTSFNSLASAEDVSDPRETPGNGHSETEERAPLVGEEVKNSVNGDGRQKGFDQHDS